MRTLVIAAHPDDETLGCGGTLLKSRAAGSNVLWLIVTQSHEPQWSADLIECKNSETKRVAEAYGIDQCYKLGFPTVMLDTVPQADLIARIRDVVSEVRPEQVLAVHGGDAHTDHQTVYTATMSVLKPSYMGQFGVRQVLCYETLSSTEAAPPHAGTPFAPNIFNDISAHMDRKIEIMAMYGTEEQPDPMPRGPSAIRALARYRGATIGVEYAEAFMLIRGLM